VLRIQQTAGVPSFQLRGNFLVRARRHLVDDQILTVMVDCPKARWESCDDAYRTSDGHAEDVGAVIDKVKADYGVSQVYLIGTSYGTVSSAFLARKLARRIDGAVHTSTFTDPRVGRGQSHGLAMWNFDWNASQAEQLFVHHRDDPCPVTRYRSIVARKGNAPLITVRGTQGARGEPCEAFSAHGIVGRERAVMLAIAQWMESRKVEETIGAEGDEP
jgi:pimeloyl-ACP methyl ester carboxylesterase